MTTRAEIEEWFDRGIDKGASHMVVVCDTFDYGDFPVYVMPEQDVNEVIKDNNNASKMLRVMEVYKMSMDKTAQMEVRRAYNL